MTNENKNIPTSPENTPPILDDDNLDFYYHAFLRTLGPSLLEPDEIENVIKRDTLLRIKMENNASYKRLTPLLLYRKPGFEKKMEGIQKEFITRMGYALQTPELPEAIKSELQKNYDEINATDLLDPELGEANAGKWRTFTGWFDGQLNKSKDLTALIQYKLDDDVEKQLHTMWHGYSKFNFRTPDETL